MKRLLALAAVFAAVLLLLAHRQKPAPPEPVAAAQPQEEAQAPAPAQAAPISTNRHHSHFVRSPLELSEEEKRQIRREFNEHMKPAIEHWCRAYSERSPFRAEDVAPEKLRGRIGNPETFIDWDFMVNKSISVGIGQLSNSVWYVCAVEVRGYEQLTDVHASGPPKADCISHEEILQHMRADLGYDLPSDEIAYYPTAAFSSVNGGIMVEAGPFLKQGWGLPVYDIVYGANGKVLHYETSKVGTGQ